MSSKYIKVSDLTDCLGDIIAPHHVAYKGFHQLQTTAQEMVSGDDIRNMLAKYSNDGNFGYEIIEELEKMINPQPEKFGGFTISEWEQLQKLPYIRVRCEDNAIRFLDNVVDPKAIIKLLPDPKNMTRTDPNIPDGIRIKVTFIDGGPSIFTTPPPKGTINIKHYRILGAADD